MSTLTLPGLGAAMQAAPSPIVHDHGDRVLHPRLGEVGVVRDIRRCRPHNDRPGWVFLVVDVEPAGRRTEWLASIVERAA